jgi:hypothetical protein
MNKTLYDWYENSRNALAQYELKSQGQESHEFDEQIDEMIKDWQEIIDALDKNHPQIKEWYMRKKSMQKSFTPDQLYFICEQIGDWYLMMKPLLKGEHNLGYMKEKLKTMICGE